MLFFASCSSLKNIENNIPSIPNQKPPGNNETLPNPPTDSIHPNGNEPKPPMSEGNKPPINIPNEQLPTFLNKEFEKKLVMDQ